MVKTAKPSRILKRKTSHSVIERRRREKINEGLIHLQDTVPACRTELRELLECKIRSNKKNTKWDEEQVQHHLEETLTAKSKSEMVLEKLCIISHTVDYVKELENKVDAYRKWCRCSPPLPDAPLTQTHDQAHDNTATTTSPLFPFISPSPSEVGESTNCQGCATLSRGKRHWGSNRPLSLSRGNEEKKMIKQSSKKEDQISQRQTRAMRKPAAKASNGQNVHNLIDSPEDESSDLELNEWKSPDKPRLCPAHLYTNTIDSQNDSTLAGCSNIATLKSLGPSISHLHHHHHHSHNDTCLRLGLLAQISAESERVNESISPVNPI